MVSVGKVLILNLGVCAGVIFALDAAQSHKIAPLESDRQNLIAPIQSNCKLFVEQTAQLHRAITANRCLFTKTRNVALIDKNGCPTLRGEVGTMRDRTLLACLTKKCLGPQYRNELTVDTLED